MLLLGSWDPPLLALSHLCSFRLHDPLASVSPDPAPALVPGLRCLVLYLSSTPGRPMGPSIAQYRAWHMSASVVCVLHEGRVNLSLFQLLFFPEVCVLLAPSTVLQGPLHCILSLWMYLLMSLSEQINDLNTANHLITGPDPSHPSFPHLLQPTSSQPCPSCPLNLSTRFPLLHSHTPSRSGLIFSDLDPCSTLLSSQSLPSRSNPPSLSGLPAPGADTAPPLLRVLQWLLSTLRTKPHP